MVYVENKEKGNIMPRKKPTNTKLKSAKAKSTPKKLEKLSQTHGKEDIVPTTLEQIWGDDGLSKYGTMDIDEYSSRITDMTKSELFAHASKQGIIPIENRDQLQKRCIREFNRHIGSFSKPQALQNNTLAKNELPLKVRKILDEGK
jgi:hypothetical protein